MKTRRKGVILDTELRIQRKGEDSYNAAGSPVSGDWEALEPDLTLWAQVRPRGGGEKVIADRLEGEVIWDVIVRNCSEAWTIVASDRALELNGQQREFYIKHAPVDPDGTGRYLAFTAKTGGTPG